MRRRRGLCCTHIGGRSTDFRQSAVAIRCVRAEAYIHQDEKRRISVHVIASATGDSGEVAKVAPTSLSRPKSSNRTEIEGDERTEQLRQQERYDIQLIEIVLTDCDFPVGTRHRVIFEMSDRLEMLIRYDMSDECAPDAPVIGRL
jgi:hypothetical protein